MRSKQNWPALLLEWQQSGLYKVAFCKLRGISYQGFLWNLKRSERTDEGEFRQILVSVTCSGERIDFHFSDGRCVSFPVSAPRKLIRFLIAQQCCSSDVFEKSNTSSQNYHTLFPRNWGKQSLTEFAGFDHCVGGARVTYKERCLQNSLRHKSRMNFNVKLFHRIGFWNSLIGHLFKTNSAMRVRSYFLVLFCCINSVLFAQRDTIWRQKPTLNMSCFLDGFYVYDFNQPQGRERQPFLFNHNRHNELNLNLGFLKLGIEQSKYRANFALQAGTYSDDNYAAEPGLLKNIFEANVGLSLNKKNNFWIDAGVFASHIGFESAVSTDNWTMTRSLLAENSPYFLSGAKLTYNPNDKWEIAGLILNGWQRIQPLQGNSLPSFGTQIKVALTESNALNWSTFIGTDDPDTIRRMRYFNNFYGQFQLTEKCGLLAGFDFGTQQRSKGSSDYDFWFSPVIIGQFAIKKTLKTAIRAEYYQDEMGIIIPTSTSNGFKTTGLSLNLDYSPIQNIICRLEGRWLNSKDKIFETRTIPTNNNFIIGTSIGIRFSETPKGKNTSR